MDDLVNLSTGPDGSYSPWLGKCHLLCRTADVTADCVQDVANVDVETVAECETVIAVWASDRREFDERLSDYLNGQGWRLIWSDQVAPAIDWMASGVVNRTAIDLARAVHTSRLVAHGPVIPLKEGLVPSSDDAFLRVERRDGIVPLDSQFGTWPRKTVPDDLYDFLFGMAENEVGDNNNDVADDKYLGTYAILDAAKIVNTTELLAVSGLEYRCLFKGDAYDDLKGVAPYIVALKEDNAFTRNLFTSAGAPWHLWPKEAGIYIRSAATLDDLWAHFRKFTKISDEQGKWYFLRFWDGMFFEYLAAHPAGPFPARFFSNISSILHFSATGRMIRIAPGEGEQPSTPDFMQFFRDFVAAQKRERFVDRAVSFLGARYGDDQGDGQKMQPDREMVSEYYAMARSMKMASELSAIKTIEAQYLIARAGSRLEEIDTTEVENFENLSDAHRADALLELASRLTGD